MKISLLKIGLYAIMLIILIRCKQEIVKQPVLLTPVQSLSLPLDSVEFAASGRDWKAILHTFTQPVPLDISYTKTGFYIHQGGFEGSIEGPGSIYLMSGDQHFYYDVVLTNQIPNQTETFELRSPKTVNPDSSLLQQRLLYRADQWCNIHYLNGQDYYFSEEKISITPKSGIYTPKNGTELSSYYVQPGSPVSIPIRYLSVPEDQIWKVTAGPLSDKNNNLVADGTLVTFIIEEGTWTHIREVFLLQGYAVIQIPFVNKDLSIIAKVHETISNTIHIKGL